MIRALNKTLGEEKNSGLCPGCLRTLIFSAGFSGFLLGIGVVNMLYLIPLQFAMARRGRKTFVYATAASLGLGGLIWLLRGPESTEVLIYLSALGLLAGLYALNWNAVVPRARILPWVRILAAATISAGATLLAVISLENQGVWDQFSDIMRENPDFARVLESLLPGLSAAEAIALTQAILYRSLVFSSGLVLLLAYALGRSLAGGTASLFYPLSRYRLPAEMIWGFILPAAGLMVSERMGWMIPAYLFWNGFLLAALLYLIRGLGIVAGFAIQKPLIRAVLPGVLILSVIAPGVNFILAIALTLLGISSVWIRYSDGSGAAPTGGGTASAEDS